MIKFIGIFLSVLVFTNVNSHTQSDTTSEQKYHSKSSEKHFSLLSGIGYQNYLLLDIGIAINKSGRVGPHPFSSAIYLSNEILLQDAILLGPKLGLYAAGGSSIVALGTSFIHYTDLKSNLNILRPEIGFGLLNVKITYGYNIYISKSEEHKISRHNIELIILFSLKKLSGK